MHHNESFIYYEDCNSENDVTDDDCAQTTKNKK